MAFHTRAEKNVNPRRTGLNKAALKRCQLNRGLRKDLPGELPLSRFDQLRSTVDAGLFLVVRTLGIRGQIHQQARQGIFSRLVLADILDALWHETRKQRLELVLIERVDMSPGQVFLAASSAGRSPHSHFTSALVPTVFPGGSNANPLLGQSDAIFCGSAIHAKAEQRTAEPSPGLREFELSPKNL